MKSIVEIILEGGVIVYPTETLYALGCSGYDHAAVKRVSEIKNRPETKPLPLIIGSLNDLDLVTEHIPRQLRRLAEAFWPGPLSILVRARDELAPGVKDEEGFTSVRVTPHPLAAALCRDAGVPLVATSANLSGKAPAALPEQLDNVLIGKVDGAWLKEPFPVGGLPSSVVRVLDDNTVRMLRTGRISRAALEGIGLVVES